MLLVLIILALFVLLVLTYLLTAGQGQRLAANQTANSEPIRTSEYNDLLDRAVRQVVRGHTDPRSVLSIHSLLEDMWGHDDTRAYSGSDIAHQNAADNGISFALQPNTRGWLGGAPFDVLDAEFIAAIGTTKMDDDYDAPDFRNMLLAMTDENGVVTPSLHRPALVRYMQTQKSTEWSDTTNKLKRRVVLRPLAEDHPDFTGSNSSFDTIVGPWDVDNDGDGTRDSIWVDLGEPPRVGTDGTLVKPLFAILCIDLDGRLDANTHSSLNHSNSPGTGYGYGPAEINLANTTTDQAALLAARYGADGIPGASGNHLATMKAWTLPISEWNPTTLTEWGSPFDVFGTGSVTLTGHGYPQYTGMPSPANSPYRIDPERGTGDTIFTLAELEAALRPNDIDSGTLPSRLKSLLGGNARNIITTRSRSSTFYTGPTDIRSTTDSPRWMRGEREDINARFGDGVDNNGNGVVDEPAEAATEIVWWKTTDTLPVGLPVAYQNVQLDISATGTDRQRYAKRLIDLAMAVTPASCDLWVTESDKKRKLAQWCANVVDFRDRDSIMTRFDYGEGVVWGAERPELLITETLAFHDRRTQDTAAGSGLVDRNVVNADHSFDQIRRPQGNLFVELYNPNGTNDARPAEFYHDGSSMQSGVLLSKTTPGGHPVWRLRVDRTSAEAPAGFYELPRVGPTNIYGYTIARDLSADGSTVVGATSFSNTSVIPSPNGFRWTFVDGMLIVGSAVAGVSHDGKSMALTSYTYSFTSPIGYRPSGVSRRKWPSDRESLLTTTGTALSGSASAISGDGRVFTAVSSNQGYRWTEADKWIFIGDLPGGSLWSFPRALSHDGSVVVGQSGSANGLEAFRWSEASGMQALGDLLGGTFSSVASDVSSDGSVVVGEGNDDIGPQAFIWTADTGRVGIGRLAGETSSSARAVSANGRYVLGTSGSRSFIWDSTNGMRDLKTYLSSLLPGQLDAWTTIDGVGISADGLVIAGNGQKSDGSSSAWVARLPTNGGNYTTPRTLYFIPKPATPPAISDSGRAFWVGANVLPVDPNNHVLVGPASSTFVGTRTSTDQSNTYPNTITLASNADMAVSVNSVDLDSSGQVVDQASSTHKLRFSVSEPVDGYPKVSSATNDDDFYADTDVADQPYDYQNDASDTHLGRDTTELIYKTIYLQRLANPLQDWHVTNNPYISVDSQPVDLTIYNGEPKPTTTGEFSSGGGGVIYFDSRQRTGSATNVWSSVSTAPTSGTTTSPLSTETLGARNSAYAASTMFPWFTWNNRPFVSHLELLLVPSGSAEAMLANHSIASGNLYDKTNGGFFHLLPFLFDSTSAGSSSSSELSRVLEYVCAPSPFVGMESFSAPTGSLHPSYSGISSRSESGKININTLSRPVWEAVLNGRSVPTFDELLASRRGFATGDESKYPTAIACPFRTFAPPGVDPQSSTSDQRTYPQPSLTGGGNLSRRSIDFSLLRPHPNDLTRPLFSHISTTADTNTTRNPYFFFQNVTRLGNMLTTSSNVYACWITVGYFEVEKVTPSTAYPDGYRLKKEAGEASGEIVRHRGFYILDRTTTDFRLQAFQRGIDVPGQEAILLERRIE